MLALVNKPFTISDESIKIHLRISSATFPHDSSTTDSLIKNTLLASKEIKKHPSKKSMMYSLDMETSLEERLILEKDLQIAIRTKELELHYQPQYSVDKKLVGFEALVRWKHPIKGTVFPNDFIPLAEETGLIVPLGKFVLSEACQQLKRWMTSYEIPLQMSVNVSGRQLQQANFAEEAKAIIDMWDVSPSLIMLEITETCPFYTDENIVALLNELKDIGFKIAIDDFGTGFCSLTSLTKIPIHQIKIAREYVNTIGTNDPDEILLKHAIRISQELQFETIAEGVETEFQLNELIKLDCDLIQGYLFSRPLTQIDATNLIKQDIGSLIL